MKLTNQPQFLHLLEEKFAKSRLWTNDWHFAQKVHYDKLRERHNKYYENFVNRNRAYISDKVELLAACRSIFLNDKFQNHSRKKKMRKTRTYKGRYHSSRNSLQTHLGWSRESSCVAWCDGAASATINSFIAPIVNPKWSTRRIGRCFAALWNSISMADVASSSRLLKKISTVVYSERSPESENW